ncbi:MAG TPA: SUMF1/EgtB/PvdO family nonheme iron enzyme, partial [Myxococcus sp.]|nr:SUMF1/EgtB/PvdO family nonheme iron enzyme [Myxococcus sp.]
VPAPPPAVAAPAPVDHEDEPPPPDATQPLDAETLAAIMGGPLPSRLLTEQALPYIMPPASAKAAPPAAPPAARAAGPAPRPSGPVQSVQARPSAPRHEAKPQEPAPAVSRHEAKTQEAAPAVSRHEAKTLEPSPAVSRHEAKTLDPTPAVSGARPAMRTLEASPTVSEARASARTLDGPAMSGARSGLRTMDSPTMSGARTGARRLDSPTMSGARTGMRTGALPTLPVTKAAKANSRSMLWLVLLSVAGLVVGAGGGFLIVRHFRQAQVAPVRPEGAGGGTPPAVAADCPSGMRLVPGGPFQMGTALDDPLRSLDDRQQSSVQVASYCVDEYEYPNQAGVMPKVAVSWSEARGLCESAGKRLCTEEEWEKACKGPGNRRFPYGNTENAEVCNTETVTREDRVLAASGKYRDCRSGPGALDMSGNVSEWTATPGDGTEYVQKGGAFDRPPSASRCSARTGVAQGDRLPSVGFRCCASVAR